MRKLFATLVLASTFSLGACATMPGGAVDPRVANIVNEVQTTTAQICRFVPTATTIANIFATGVPAVGAVATIANGICGAISQAPKLSRRGRALPPKYLGVVIKGKRV